MVKEGGIELWVSQRDAIGFEEQAEQRFGLGGTHLPPDRAALLAESRRLDLVKVCLLPTAECGQRFDNDVFLGTEVIEEAAGAGSDGLGQGAEGEIGQSMLDEVFDDGGAQFVGAVVVNGAAHERECTLNETIVSIKLVSESGRLNFGRS